MNYFELLVAIGKLGGVFAVLAGLKLWVFDPVRQLYKWGKTHIEKIEKLVVEVSEIRSELSRNGGNSTKDGIVEIRETISLLNERARIMMHDDDRGIFETDASGQCTYVNRAYARLVGRAAHECLGWAWKSIVHEDDRHAVSSEWEQCVKEGREFAMQYRYVATDNRILLVEVRAMVMRGPKAAKCAGHVGFVTLKHEERNPAYQTRRNRTT